MNEQTREDLIQVARRYYPTGFPVEEDDLSEPIPAYQRTPEHERFMEAWEQALKREDWKALMRELRTLLPSHGVGGGTQPFVSACLRCFVYWMEPTPEGGQHVTRMAAAVSILSPFYLVYVTTQTWYPRAPGNGPRASPPRLSFEPPPQLKPQTDTLADLVERMLGGQPFPLELAKVALPGLRVSHFSGEPPPTLLDALFSEDLDNLP